MKNFLVILLVTEALTVRSVDRIDKIILEVNKLSNDVKDIKEIFSDTLGSIADQITEINSKLEQILPQRSMRIRSVAGGVPPRKVIVSHGQDEDEDEEDFSEVEEEMVNLFRKITSPLRRVRQRKFSVDKLESDIAAVKAGMERSNMDLRRTLSDFITNTGEIAQEQNHMIEGISTNVASLLQVTNDHSTAFYRHVSSSTRVMDKLDTWMVDWQHTATQKMDRLEQEQSYNMQMVRDQVKMLENVVVEGFDRQWQCTGGQGHGAEYVTVTPTTTRRTTTTTVSTTSSTTRSTTTMITVSTTETTTDAIGTTPIDYEYDYESSYEVVENDKDDTEEMVSDYKDCWQQMQRSSRSASGVYVFRGSQNIEVGARHFNRRYCDMETDGGGWTVIQRRGQFASGHVNFTRSWDDYKSGFGDMSGEFWFGNNFISEMTSDIQNSMVLRVDLMAHDGRQAFAEYSTFRVDSESELYRIWVGGYSGNASDSLSAHNGFKFSTIDNNNDHAPKCCPCAPAYGGGWWFYSCFEANLNGEYFTEDEENGYYRGIIWELWLGDYSLKETKMMVRPLTFNSNVGQEETYWTPADP